MEYPKISLILLAYNDEATIEEALKSIWGQNYFEEKRDVLLLIMPNGCKDGTETKIETFLQSNGTPKGVEVRVIVSPNGGRNRTLNNGLKMAEGKYVFYMNADCTISKGALRGAVELFENDEKVKIIGLNDSPRTDGVRSGSTLEGIYRVIQGLGEIKEKLVPVGRFIGLRGGVIEKVPENIHSEDTWLDLTLANKYGIEAIRVLQREYVYWTPPADWASFINLFARYQRGNTQLFEVWPEGKEIYLKIVSQVKRKTLGELEELMQNYLEKTGMEKEKAKDSYKLYQYLIRIFVEQEEILRQKLIDTKTGVWVTDR